MPKIIISRETDSESDVTAFLDETKTQNSCGDTNLTDIYSNSSNSENFTSSSINSKRQNSANKIYVHSSFTATASSQSMESNQETEKEKGPNFSSNLENLEISSMPDTPAYSEELDRGGEDDSVEKGYLGCRIKGTYRYLSDVFNSTVLGKNIKQIFQARSFVQYAILFKKIKYLY